MLIFSFFIKERQSRFLKYQIKLSKNNYSESYLKNILKIVDQTRLYFPESYFGLSLVSKCGLQTNDFLINAQKEVINLRKKVFISADSDSIFGERYRYDKCHFTQEGIKELGKMYEESFKLNIFDY